MVDGWSRRVELFDSVETTSRTDMLGDGPDAGAEDLLARVIGRIVRSAAHDGRQLWPAHGGEVEHRSRADAGNHGDLQAAADELVRGDLQITGTGSASIMCEDNPRDADLAEVDCLRPDQSCG